MIWRSHECKEVVAGLHVRAGFGGGVSACPAFRNTYADADADADQDYVDINPFSLLLGEISLEYEHAMNRSTSILVGPQILAFPGLGTTSGISEHGAGATASVSTTLRWPRLARILARARGRCEVGERYVRRCERNGRRRRCVWDRGVHVATERPRARLVRDRGRICERTLARRHSRCPSVGHGGAERGDRTCGDRGAEFPLRARVLAGGLYERSSPHADQTFVALHLASVPMRSCRSGFGGGSRRRRESPLVCPRRLPWAELLRRVFADDILRCDCDGARIITAFVADGPAARAALDALGLASQPAALAPARAPPQLDLDWADPLNFDRLPRPRPSHRAPRSSVPDEIAPVCPGCASLCAALHP